MPKRTPRAGDGGGRGTANSVTGRADNAPFPAPKQTHSPSAPALDLAGLRVRLLKARRRLVERIALEYGPERNYPDSFWIKLLADIQAGIAAVNAVAAEGEKGGE